MYSNFNLRSVKRKKKESNLLNNKTTIKKYRDQKLRQKYTDNPRETGNTNPLIMTRKKTTEPFTADS